MKIFPSILNITNKNKFPQIYYNRLLSYLRKSIYEHMIKEDENNYIDLDAFSTLHGVKDKKLIEQMVKTLVNELNNLGWKCKISFGGTGLFIYSSHDPPPSCWEDDNCF